MKQFAIAAALAGLTGTAPGLVAPGAAQHHEARHHMVHRGAVHRGPLHHRDCFWQVRHHHRVRVCR